MGSYISSPLISGAQSAMGRFGLALFALTLLLVIFEALEELIG
jgi:hypothetical protein